MQERDGRRNGPGVVGRMERFMEPCLLLSLRGRRAHGYELTEKLKAFGFEGTSADMATLYRTLRHLEEQGVVVSAWEEGSQGPPKRVYELTEAGQALLRDWVRTIKANRSRLDRFLSAYEEPCRDSHD